MKLNRIKLVGINRSYDGIDLRQLEMIFKNEDIKFFYTIPRLHNPLGTNYSEKIKKEIAYLAVKYDVYIVEDDYLADIDGRALPINYYDISHRTIYVKSFSKTFMPGIRIGTVVLHENLIKEFSRHKRCDDLNTSVLAQGALDIYIKSGMYKNHIKKAKLEYRKKMDFLREYTKNLDMSKIELIIPETGFFLWVKLSNDINIDTLEKRLKDKKVIISPGINYFIDNNYRANAFRLCISKLSRDQIKLGIEIIFDEINKL